VISYNSHDVTTVYLISQSTHLQPLIAPQAVGFDAGRYITFR